MKIGVDFFEIMVYNNTRPLERYSNGKEPHWKCGVPTRHCAFESHPLRQLRPLLNCSGLFHYIAVYNETQGSFLSTGVL